MAGGFGNINDNNELVATLNKFRWAAIYDILGQTLLQKYFSKVLTGEADPNEIDTILPEGIISVQDMINFHEQNENYSLIETKKNANRLLTANLLKTTFRITQSYCEENSQIHIFRAQPWYQFSRMITNSLSHNYRFDFRPNDLRRLPIIYNDQILDENLNGKPLRMPLEILINLVDEIIDFSKTKIS